MLLALQRHNNFFKKSTVSSFKPQQACESMNSTTLTEIQTLVHVIKTHQVTPKSHLESKKWQWHDPSSRAFVHMQEEKVMAFEREKKVVVMRSISQFICTYAGGG
jgi:hypothetical protein